MPRKRATPAKPTPGPYTIERLPHGASIRGAGGLPIAWFGVSCSAGKDVAKKEAHANAQAWIDGQAAIEALEKIRIVWNDQGLSWDEWDETHRRIAVILGVAA
jgi:hypothetical protein